MVRSALVVNGSCRQQIEALVQANVALCREHYRLTLRVDGFPPTSAGQFVQIACTDLHVPCSDQTEMTWEPGSRMQLHDPDLLGPRAFLRRPFSLAGRRDTNRGIELEIIHRAIGVGTAWLSRLEPGDTVNILGPLGNGFELPAKNQVALLVGGGVGIPPMLYLAEKLSGRKAIAFCGATTRDLLPLTITADGSVTEFARHGIEAVITTDDGSFGVRGLVTQALERHLDYFSNHHSSFIIYTCGPEAMMKRVAEIAIARNIPCQVAVERAMACGMGTCQSCVIRVRANGGWVYKLACTDGPVFSAADLLW